MKLFNWICRDKENYYYLIRSNFMPEDAIVEAPIDPTIGLTVDMCFPEIYIVEYLDGKPTVLINERALANRLNEKARREYELSKQK